MKHGGKFAVALLGLAGLGAAALGWSAVNAARAQDIPPGPEAMLVEQTCTGCHGASEFTVMRLSPDQWSSILDEMVSMGAQISDPDRVKILAYLVANFPDAAAAAAAPAGTPTAGAPAAGTTPPADTTPAATPPAAPAPPAAAQ